MAQVDAFRFLANVALLFAPHIHDGQVFNAYIGEDNSFTVQVDNIINSSGGNNSGSTLDIQQLDEFEQRLSSLQSQADDFEAFCLNIPDLQSQILSLSGSIDSEASIDFNYAYLIEDLRDIRAELYSLSSQVEQLSNNS